MSTSDTRDYSFPTEYSPIPEPLPTGGPEDDSDEYETHYDVDKNWFPVVRRVKIDKSKVAEEPYNPLKGTSWEHLKPMPPGYGVHQMEALDLFKFGDCNIDPLTETYQTEFYMDYLDRWPECCNVVKTRNGRVAAYLLGKIESSPFLSSPTPYDPDTNTNPNYLPWHAHITALTVASWARGIGLGTKLSEALELVAEAQNCWFIDLFVRTDNEIAIKLYKKLGYTVYKRVVNYYNDGEDAFDMRKPLPRDKDKKHIRENGEDFHVDPSNVW